MQNQIGANDQDQSSLVPILVSITKLVEQDLSAKPEIAEFGAA
ncbi:hypothetical protein [Lacticaseibacillus chiayiensis]|uniref:Uncharacterized protein n=1 Tax=Lacticaseibacillus chiayiensis TaxID=2100821 RepID=A0ABY6H4B7_9LACO|nr:hypothetical protein [Lacticaseibacillus chiayiensis]UYN56196.1 hypothetical protein OFW50_12105 [Lacticaseibacillus chiayiensis]